MARAQGISWVKWIWIGVFVVAGFIGLYPRHVRNPDWMGPTRLGTVHLNLQAIDGAKEQWSLEDRKQASDSGKLLDLTGYLKDAQVPQSVAGETYSVTMVGEPTRAVTKVPIDGFSGPFTTTSF